MLAEATQRSCLPSNSLRLFSRFVDDHALRRRWSFVNEAVTTIGVQRMPGFRFCLMLAASCPAPLTPVVKRQHWVMNDRQAIVPPRQREKTRRIICRPKTRFCSKASLLFAAILVLLLFGFLGDDWNSSTAKTISAICAALVLLSGVAALICRIMERRREVLVRDWWDWGDPPVIHLESKP